MRPSKIQYWWTGSGGGTSPDALAGSLVYLTQPDGRTVSNEFLRVSFVSRETTTEADETLYLYFNNF